MPSLKSSFDRDVFPTFRGSVFSREESGTTLHTQNLSCRFSRTFPQMASFLKSRFDHDVYISLRGPDSHYFCSFLYESLGAQRIRCFLDSEHVVGETIGTTLIKAIARSRILVPIFSANFADSGWCLAELEEFMRQTETKGQLVVPIFYGVESSEVRRQLRAYGEALERHKYRGLSETKVEEWSLALSKAGCLPQVSRSEHEIGLIQDIVKAISAELTRFDVFLNFRGEDVRKDFVKSLYEALVQKGIDAFIDSEKLRKGVDFPPALMDAIEQSRMYVVIFSENYAESKRCLQELVEILKRKKEKQKLILPIFYKVEPRDVRGQKQSYKEALAKHEIEYGTGSEVIKEWRAALSESAYVTGTHLCDGNEDDGIRQVIGVIEKMMGEIRCKLE